MFRKVSEINKIFTAPVGSAACRRVSGTCDQWFVETAVAVMKAVAAAAAAAAGAEFAEPLGEPTIEIDV